jgi:hypothetical protein
MNKIVIGGLYQLSSDKALWEEGETHSRHSGVIQPGTLFVVLYDFYPLSKTSYTKLKILTTDGKIGHIYCYASEPKELSG